jgi:hypothetical protein
MALSNSPCEIGPGELIPYIQFTNRNAPIEWDSKKHARLFFADKIRQIAVGFEYLSSTGSVVFGATKVKMLQSFKHVLQGLMTRRTSKSRWLENRIYTHKSLAKRDVPITTTKNDRIQTALRELRENA